MQGLMHVLKGPPFLTAAGLRGWRPPGTARDVTMTDLQHTADESLEKGGVSASGRGAGCPPR